MANDDAFPMRQPCPNCGGQFGLTTEKSGQDVIRCSSCNAWVYNRPKTESGKAIRSVSTGHNGLKPKHKTAVRLRAGQRCELCGRPAVATQAGLVVDHMLSIEDGLALGLTETQLNHIENLAAMCEECNLGKGATTLPLWLVVSIIKARTKPDEVQQ